MAWHRRLHQSWSPRSQREIFRWHCQLFHPFTRTLTTPELAYLEQYFDLPGTPQSPPTRHACFPELTYSHRIQGASVNSSRLVAGSWKHPALLLEKAQCVFDAHQISIPADLQQATFFGLGWDVLHEIFCVYFRVVAPEQTDAVKETGELLCLRYQGHQLLSRTQTSPDKAPPPPARLFCAHHPDEEARFPLIRRLGQELSHTARDEWRPLLTYHGQRILKQYESKGEPVSHIKLHTPDDFALYYP